MDTITTTTGERDDDSLDTKAAARFLGCSESKLRKSRVHGGGPVYVKDGKSVRYVRRDLREFRDVRKRRSTSNAPVPQAVRGGEGCDDAA
jgi:hypothetical protein